MLYLLAAPSTLAAEPPRARALLFPAPKRAPPSHLPLGLAVLMTASEPPFLRAHTRVTVTVTLRPRFSRDGLWEARAWLWRRAVGEGGREANHGPAAASSCCCGGHWGDLDQRLFQ